MKNYLSLLLTFCLPYFCFGQSGMTLKGSILDAENNKPISYAHIGIPSDYIGTVSGLNGTFKLILPQSYRQDTLHVSAIGYHTKQIPMSSILNSKSFKIRLQPKTYQMKLIMITHAEPEIKWIGKKIRPILSASYGRNISHEKIGAAYAFRINWDGSLPLKLLHARMFLKRNLNDSLKMRCSIAAVDSSSKLPGRNLIQQAVVTTLSKDKG